jgi:hypothetical protein
VYLLQKKNQEIVSNKEHINPNSRSHEMLTLTGIYAFTLRPQKCERMLEDSLPKQCKTELVFVMNERCACFGIETSVVLDCLCEYRGLYMEHRTENWNKRIKGGRKFLNVIELD